MKRTRQVRFAEWIAYGLVVLATLVLSGHALDIHRLQAPIGGTRPMVPLTAAAFLVSGVALRLLAARARPARRLGRALAAITASGFVVGFVLTMMPSRLGVDDATLESLPAPETSLAFVLVELALLLRDLPGRRAWISEGLASAAL